MKLLLVFALVLLVTACIQPTPPELEVWPPAGCPQDYDDYRGDRWAIYAEPYQGAAEFQTYSGRPVTAPYVEIVGWVHEGRTEFFLIIRGDESKWTDELRIGPPGDLGASFTLRDEGFLEGPTLGVMFSPGDSERIVNLLKDLEALDKPAVFSSANGEHRSYFYLKGLAAHLERFESCWVTPAE